MLGGLAGEEVMCGDITSGSTDDMGKARRYIRMLMNVGAFGFDKLLPHSNFGRISTESFPISESKLQRIEETETQLLEDAFERAKSLITENKDLVELIYKELKQNEKLSKCEVEAILNGSNGKTLTNS